MNLLIFYNSINAIWLLKYNENRIKRLFFLSRDINSGKHIRELRKHLKTINSKSQYPIQCININGSKNYDLADILEHFNKYIFSVDKRIIKILQLMRLMKINTWNNYVQFKTSCRPPPTPH